MDFIDAIINFFSSLAGGSSPEKKKQKILKGYKQDLASAKPALYNLKTEKLSGKTGKALMELFFLTAPLRTLLEKTLYATNAVRKEEYLIHLIEATLGSSMKEIHEKLQKEPLSNRLKLSNDPQREKQLIRQEIRQYKLTMEGAEAEKLNKDLNNLEILLDLCQLDYTTMLKFFDPSFRVSETYKPRFHEIAGKRLEEDFMDIYMSLSLLEFNESLSRLTLLLLEKSSTEDEYARQEKQIKKNLALLQKMSMTHFSPVLLLKLIRILKEDPEFSPSIAAPQKNHMEEIKTKMCKLFEKNVDITQKQEESAHVEEDLKRFLQDQPLPEFKGYDNSFHKELNQYIQGGVSMILPLRLLKAFYKYRMTSTLTTVLKKIFNDGFFEDKEFYRSYRTAIKGLMQGFKNIQNYENEMNTPEGLSFSELQDWVKQIKEGTQTIELLHQQVDMLNQQSKEILTDNVKNIKNLHQHINYIISDWKSPSPLLISNIRTLNGNNNHKFMHPLLVFQDEIDAFYTVMSHYIPIAASSS